jgi:hypothetical protein
VGIEFDAYVPLLPLNAAEERNLVRGFPAVHADGRVRGLITRTISVDGDGPIAMLGRAVGYLSHDRTEFTIYPRDHGKE